MNKKNEFKNLKKIISITKTKSINKKSKSPKTKSNKIENIKNIKLHINKNEYEENKCEKKLKISKEKGLDKNNDNEKINDNNYFDFKAHFKYKDLVEALNSLNNKKSHYSSLNEEIKGNTNKQDNTKIISRNIMMNNYDNYLRFIEESKNNDILTNLQTKINKNKTSYFPKTESIKNNIFFKFKKNEERKNINEKKSISKYKSKSKSKSKEKKYSNKSGKISKEENSKLNHGKYYNLINISSIKSRHKHNNNGKKNSKSSSKNKRINKKNKIESETHSNSNNKKILTKKENNFIKRKTFQNMNINITRKRSNNIKIINKQSNEKIKQNINKRNKSKENQKNKYNNIKNILNINQNTKNISSNKEKAHSTSISRKRNKTPQKIKKNINIFETNNIKTLNRSKKSKSKKKKSNTNILSNSIPFTLKKENNKKINSIKKIKYFRLRLISLNNKNNLNNSRFNKKEKHSIQNTLINHTSNIISNFRKSKSKSNSNTKYKANSNKKDKKIENNMGKIKLKKEKSKIQNKNDKSIHIIKKEKNKMNNDISEGNKGKIYKTKNIKNFYIFRTKNISPNKMREKIKNSKGNNITEYKILSHKKRGIYLFLTEQNEKKFNKTKVFNIIKNRNNNINSNTKKYLNFN